MSSPGNESIDYCATICPDARQAITEYNRATSEVEQLQFDIDIQQREASILATVAEAVVGLAWDNFTTLGTAIGLSADEIAGLVLELENVPPKQILNNYRQTILKLEAETTSLLALDIFELNEERKAKAPGLDEDPLLTVRLSELDAIDEGMAGHPLTLVSEQPIVNRDPEDLVADEQEARERKGYWGAVLDLCLDCKGPLEKRKGPPWARRTEYLCPQYVAVTDVQIQRPPRSE